MNRLSDSTKKQKYLDVMIIEKWELAVNSLKAGRNRIISVSNVTANMYVGDFHGLLLSLDVPDAYLYIHTRVNGLYDPNEYLGKTSNILLIPNDTLDAHLTLFSK